MKKDILIVLFLILFSGYCIAQEDSLRLIRLNSVFIELGGTSGHFSINYNREIYLKNNFGFTLGVGFSPSLVDFVFSPRFPFQAKFFYKIKKHSVESGFGLTPYVWYNNDGGFSENLNEVKLAIFGEIGYKYSIIKQKFYIGIAFTPMIYDAWKKDLYPWGALRFGYKF
jgi:hypothetical protein